MNVEVLESGDRELVLRIEGTTVATMNALRRTLMMEVPKLAIEDVTIYDNKSALFDEIIAHRLGLLPVPTDPTVFASWDATIPPKEQDETTQVLYTLTFEGPGTVYGSDLKPATGEEFSEIAEPEVPIVKLGRDQRLMLEATALLGSGTTHAKWQPVVGAGYREYPTVEITGPLELSSEDKHELLELAPEGAIEVDGDELKVLDTVAGHDYLYNVNGRYDLSNVEFGHEEDAFIFQFETDGSLTAKQAFREAIRVLMGKLKEIEDQANELQ